MSHAGGLNKFETKLGLEDKWSLEAEHDRTQKSALRVKTPVNKYEQMSLEVSHTVALPKVDITAELRTSHPRVPSITAELHHDGLIEKFNSELKLTTPFTNMNSQSLRVEYEGQPQNFEGKVAVTTSIPKYESVIYEVKHQGNLRSFKSSASLEYGDYKKIEGAINMKLHNLAQAQGSINFKSPIPNFDDMSLSFRNRFNARQKSVSHASSVSWTQGKKITVDATYDNNAGNLKLTTPFENLRELVLDLTGKYQPWDINMKANADYNGDRWLSLDSAYSGTNHHIGRMTVTTLWAPLRQASVDFDGKFDLTDMSLKTEIQHNGRKWVDGEMMYRKNQNRHVGRLALRQPHPMTHNFNVLYAPRQVDGDATINWNTRNQNSKIQMELNVQDRRYKKEVVLKAVLPSRTVGLTTTTESRNGLSHKTELTWDQARDRKVALEFNQEGDKYDGKLTTPIRSLAMTLDKSKSYRSQKVEGELLWDADRDQSKKLTLKGQMNQLPDGAAIITTIKHPMLRRDITISSEFRSNDSPMYSGKLEVEYAPEPSKKLTLSSKVGNIGTNNYTVELEFSHPESGVDISMAANAGDENGRMTGNFLYRYQDESMALRGEINKIRKEIRSQMVGSYSWMTPWLMEGKMNTKRDGYLFELKNTYEKTRHGHPHTVNTVLDVNTEAPAFDLKSTGSHGKIYSHIFAKYPNSSAVLFKAMHDMGEGPVDDAEIFINLIGNHLLHEKYYLRLAMKDDIKAYLGSVRDYYAEKRKQYMQSPNTLYTPEVASFKREMEPVLSYLNGELSSFENDFATMKQEIRMMYRRNEFFMKDMGEAYTAAARYISEKIDEMERMYEEMKVKMTAKIEAIVAEMDRVKREAIEFMSTLKVNGMERYNQLMDELKTKYEELRTEMMQFYQEQAQKMREKMQPFVEKYNEYYRQAMVKIDEHKHAINHKMDEYMQKVRAHPYYSKVFDFHQKSMASIRDAINSRDWMKPLRELHLNARQMLSGLHQVASKNYDVLSNKYAEAIYQARDNINAKIDEVLSHPQVAYAKDMAHHMVEKGMDYYKYYKLEENVKHHLQSIYDSGRMMAEKRWQSFLHDYLQINRTRIIRYDPKEFILEFEVFNPIPLKDLMSMPELNLDVYRERLDAMVKKYTPKDDMNMWDLYYTYKPSSDIRDWVPPFKAHASLIGSQHFMTFDHKHFEYAGKCSYILARDFIDGNFTAIVNYDGSRDAKRKSITVFSDDKSIEIAPDFTVRVGAIGGDSKKEELPFEFKSTTVRRQGDVVRIDNSNGVTIMCNWAHDVCSLNMTGWYFGKTAGLFGTYDNEMSNDFLTSEKKITENAGEFAYSWKVQPRCNSRHNLARTVPATEGTDEYNKCAALFKEKTYSPYRYCFKQVDPQPYFEMCVNHMSRLRTADAMCSVAVGYVQDCARHGVNLRLESRCVQCKYNRISKTEGETFTLSDNGDANVPKTADVIFVIEEKTCNKDFNFKLLTRTIEKDMKGQGLKSVKFGIVGYGGAGVHDIEHQHTIQGELLGHAHDIASTSMTFLHDGRNSDALRAVDFAARYPFRTGSSKTIILVPCSSCRKMSVDYSDIQSLLVPSGIKFHVMMQHEFQLKSNRRSPKTNYIFGVDGNTAFTSKTSDIQGDRALFKQIAIPKDLCVALALETNGSVFNSLKLEQGRWSDKKLFADSVAQRVASTSQPSECQVCECRKGDQEVGITVCRKCGATSGDTFKMSEMFLDSYNFNRDLQAYLSR
ncbi:uncharacterized protein LOC106176762 [Lingula anatina]|uniref:Uncharacterized protein LOC106176762 n=1 Tax=Lingula anatina TaxID=7574 RepID=A0A2R2MIG4_LINAN|nr:uncharacterized protein LOC106176762 [Lingula anatina]|eukprot:XP_023930015.1 uncharacterized protein LOC106176762 [Lingula anatina]